MPNWSVLIPLAPHGKARARVVRTKRGRTIAFTPAKTARYEEQILRFAAASWGARPRVQGPVFVDVSAAMPVPRSWKLARREAACDGFISHTSRPDLDNIIKEMPASAWGTYSKRFKIGGVKITIDVSPQGRTALFITPYLTGGPGGEKSWSGELTFPQDIVNQAVKRVYDLGVPLTLRYILESSGVPGLS